MYFDKFPSTVFYFEVEIDLIFDKIKCNEVSGLEVELKSEVAKIGTDKNEVYWEPGAYSYPDLVLKRGFVQNSALFEWVKEWLFSDNPYGQFRNEGADFRNITVTMNTAGNVLPVLEWKFERAWPCKISFSDLNASKSEIMFESLSFKYTRMLLEYK